jgi:hypothetical protein
MTRAQQLREARRFLGLPHSAADDDVSRALQYIDFRDQAFRATKQRHSKPMKRAARSFAQAWVRAQKAGLPMPPSSYWFLYAELAGRTDIKTELLYSRGDFNDPGAALLGTPKRADGFKKRLALQAAFRLLSDRDRPCRASRNGAWCKLAAILYGQPKADMLAQARQLRIPFGLSE